MNRKLWLFLILIFMFLVGIGTVSIVNHPELLSSKTAAIREKMPAGELELPTGLNSPNMQDGSVFFVGNATVIIRYAGFTILTDPNFLHAGDHVHLGYGLRATCLTNPAIELEQLPPIDLIVLSHMHEDHFDRLVQKRLNRAIPIVTTLQADRDLEGMGFKTTFGLKKWDTLRVRKGTASLGVTAMPGKHGPGSLNLALPEMNGNMLEFSRPNGTIAYRIYISGDTLLTDELNQIPELYPNIDLVLLHLGGTRVLGVMVTMDGKQGTRALQIIAPQTAIPIHYNDYDRFKSRLSDFAKAVKAAGLESKIRYLKPGETYTFHPSRTAI